RQLEFLQVDVHLLECLTAVHGHLPPESAAVRKIGRPIPASVRPVSKSLKKAARTVAGHSGAAAKNPPIQWGLPALARLRLRAPHPEGIPSNGFDMAVPRKNSAYSSPYSCSINQQIFRDLRCPALEPGDLRASSLTFGMDGPGSAHDTVTTRRRIAVRFRPC